MQADVGSHLLISCSSFVGRTAVEAMRPQDGLIVWSYDLPQELGSILPGQGAIYLSTHVWHRQGLSEPARITALRASDGAEMWRIGPERVESTLSRVRVQMGLRAFFRWFSLKAVQQVVRDLQFAGGITFCIAGNALLVGHHSFVFAFDTEGGELRWTGSASSNLTPTVLGASRESVYVPREWRGFEAWSAATGKLMWSSASPQYLQKVVAGDRAVYAITTGSNKPEITTLQAQDGSIMSTYSLRPGMGEEIRLLAVTPEGTAYLLRDHRLAAIRLEDRRELWSNRWPEQVISSTADQSAEWITLECGERHVILAFRQCFSTSSTLHVGAFASATGEKLWEWESGEALSANRVATLVTAVGVIYVRNHEYVYALSAETGNLLWKLPATGLGRLFSVAILAE